MYTNSRIKSVGIPITDNISKTEGKGNDTTLDSKNVTPKPKVERKNR